MNTKKFTAFLLSVLMILQMCVVTISAEDAQEAGTGYSGRIGENLTWSLDPNGCLTIDGYGEMPDFPEIPAPWSEFSDEIFEIIIYSIESIGDNAFAELSAVTKVSIPACVTSIGKNAFFGCTGLTEIVIPSSVTTIENSAFADCETLSRIIFEGDVPTSFGETVFDGVAVDFKIYYESEDSANWATLVWTDANGNNYLTVEMAARGRAGEHCSFILDTNGNMTITGTGAMDYYLYNEITKNSIQSVVIGDGITTVGNSMFSDCSNLASVSFSSDVTKIGARAFQNCIALNTVTFGANLTELGNNAFAGCTSLESVIFDNCNPTMGGYVFECCTALKNVNLGNALTRIGDYAFYTTGLTSIDIPDSVTSIGNSAFEASTLEKITIPSSVTELGSGVFFGCTFLKQIVFEGNVPTSFGSIGLDQNDNFSIYYYANTSGWTRPTWKTPDGYYTYSTVMLDSDGNETTIPDGHCGENARWTLDDNGILTVSGSGDMFDYTSTYEERQFLAPWYNQASSIKEIHIGEGITSIGQYAFMNCYNVTNVVIPTTVKVIKMNAFDCIQITDLVIPNGVEEIRSWAFSNCSSLTSVSFPASVKSIGAYPFHATNVKTITVDPNNAYYTSENSIIYTKDKTELLFCAPAVRGTVTIPSSVTKVHDEAFNYCQADAIEWSGNTVASIGCNAFSECDNLSTLVLPEGITYLDSGAVSYCNKLETLILPSTLTEFRNTPIRELPNLNRVLFLGNAPAYDWFNESNYPFINCPDDVVFYYMTGKTGWSEEKGWTQTPDGKSYEAVELSTGDHFAMYHEGVAATCTAEGQAEHWSCHLCGKLFSDEACTVETTTAALEIPTNNNHANTEFRNASETYSGDLYCNDCQKTIKTGVALTDTSGICGENLYWTINDGVLTISGIGEMYDYDHASWNNFYDRDPAPWYGKNITSIVIEDGVTSIGEYAFSCIDVPNVMISSSVKVVKQGAFADNYGIKSIVFPEGVVEIQRSVLINTDIESVSLPSTVEILNLFPINSWSLSTVTIADNNPNYTVEDSFVYNKEKSELIFCFAKSGSITVPTSVTKIGDSAFNSCFADNIQISHTITEYGSSVFRSITAKALSIPEGVTRLNSDIMWCNNLETLILPSTLESIDEWSIRDNSNLKAIYFKGNAPTEGDTYNDIYTFTGSHEDLVIYFNANSEGWTTPTWNYYGTEYKTEVLPESGHNIFHATELRDVVEVTDTTNGYTGDTYCLDCQTVVASGKVIPAGGGFCGDNLVWSLVDGVLTISGTGAMYDYDHVDWNWFYNRDPAPWNGKTVDSVIIESGVTNIGTFAFSGCSLKNGITIPTTVKTIGDGAFENANFNEITIPEGVETIDDAFLNCYAIDHMYLPASLKTIAFPHRVGTVVIAEDNPYMTVYNGGVYSKDMTKLIFHGTSSTDPIVLPETVTSIGFNAIRSSNTTGIVWNQAIKTIEDQNFMDCYGITSLEIPEGIETLSYNSITRCGNLVTVIFPDTLTKIDECAIRYMNSLTNVYFKGDAPAFAETNSDEWKTFYKCPNITVFFDEGAEGFEIENGMWTTPQGITVKAKMIPAGEEFVPNEPANPNNPDNPVAPPTFSGYTPQEDHPSTICFNVPYAEKQWIADGIISEGEYQKMDVKPSQLSYAVANADLKETVLHAPISLYMSYDDNYVYIAATTPADKYVCDIDYSNEGNMWAAHALQVSLANIDATYSAERVELGYTLSTLDNKLHAVSWFDPMGIAYDPDDAKDYTVIKNGNTVTYEMRIPFAAFEEKALKEGDKFLGSIVWAIGTSEDGGSNAYAHIQLGYGMSGDPGKDPRGHATFTLGEPTPPSNALGERQYVDVVYASPEIDGILNKGEWNYANAVEINADNAVAWAGNTISDTAFYTAWDDTGLYIAGILEDEDICIASSIEEVYNLDAMQFALDPAGLLGNAGIGGGMFFSMGPLTDGTLGAVYHPYGDQTVEAFDYTGKYSSTTNGWQFEMLIPWTSIEILAEDGYEWTHAENEVINALFCVLDRDEEGAVANLYQTSISGELDFSPVSYPYGLKLVKINTEPPSYDSPGYTHPKDAPSTIQFTVPYKETKWNADGVISEGEYEKMNVKESQLSYAAANADLKATAMATPTSLYMSYDDNYVYFAATTPATNYVCDIDDSNAGNMWAAHALQLSLANIDATDAGERLEVGYALSSLDNELYAVSWFDPTGVAYDPDDAGDYIVVKDGTTLTYEMRVPFEAFVEETLTEGDSFLGSVVWEVGTSEDGGSDAYTHIQLGYGVTGDPGKDPRGHATFTLGEKPGDAEPDTPEIPDTTDYDAYLNPSMEIMRPGTSFTLEFYIPGAKKLDVTAFSLTDLVYDHNALVIDAENIEILTVVDPAIKNIEPSGRLVMAFNGAETLSGSIIRIPVTVLDTAEDAVYEISCKAKYEYKKDMNSMSVASAVITVDSNFLYGDLNLDGFVNSADAVLLLWHIFLPKEYPIAPQPTDYNGDGIVSSADAVHLLWHVFEPNDYPLY